MTEISKTRYSLQAINGSKQMSLPELDFNPRLLVKDTLEYAVLGYGWTEIISQRGSDNKRYFLLLDIIKKLNKMRGVSWMTLHVPH